MSNEHILEELRTRQRRLGTPAEQPEDMNAARDLAHLLNNQLTADALREFVNGTKEPFATDDTPAER
jgi:hypothetical protein